MRRLNKCLLLYILKKITHRTEGVFWVAQFGYHGYLKRSCIVEFTEMYFKLGHVYVLYTSHEIWRSCDRESWQISYNKTKYMHLILKFILERKSSCFGQFLCPSSGVFHCTHSNGICHTGMLTACEQEHLLLLTSYQHTCMTYTIAVCTVKNSWWWTEELSETCRFSFQNKFEN